MMRLCPETCIGVVICCSKLNISISYMNFLAIASLESSRWKLKSPETSKTSGHNTVVSRKAENPWKNTPAGTGCPFRIRRTIDDHKVDYPAMRR